MSGESKTSLIVIVIAVAGVVVAATGVGLWLVLSGDRDEPTLPLTRTPASQPPADESAKPKRSEPKGDSELWVQDIGAAQARAARESKDILLSFEGSDWCIWCQRMEREIFTAPDFVKTAPTRFVLVKIDFPRDEPARSLVRNPHANEQLQRRFGVSGYPAVILTDAAGEAFGRLDGFFEGGAGPYLAALDRLRQVRIERDRLLAEIDAQQGAAKLPAARRALEFLSQRQLVDTLKKQLPVWLKLARQFDPSNEGRSLEQFFEYDWFYRFQAAPTARLPALMDEVGNWRKEHGDFRDKERSAFIWSELAKGKAELEDIQGAFRCLDEGLKLRPKDARTLQFLRNGPLALGLGTGTAFAVSDTGHFVTNAHVVSGPGKIFLQLPGHEGLIRAERVAEKPDVDLALLKAAMPGKVRIKPLTIAADHVARRGEEVGAWGFPLGGALGLGLKLTKGVISGFPEPATRNMLLLDLRIHPGNSGSPLCDARGNVIGIVTARSLTPGDSYGLAVPARELYDFLRSHAIKPGATAAAKKLGWDEIDRRVSAAAAMVIKARPRPKAPMPAR